MYVPYESGRLDADDGHQVHWECHGNPAGRPAIYFHGGPGGSFSSGMPQLFDLHAYRLVLFDSGDADEVDRWQMLPVPTWPRIPPTTSSPISSGCGLTWR